MAWRAQVPSCSTSCWSSSLDASLRITRRTSAPAMSRSRSSSLAVGIGADCSISRRDLTNSPGSLSTRSRISGPPPRQAAYSSPTSRVDRPSAAIPSASRVQSSTLARAIGTRCFIAAWAPIRPSRTCPCTTEGSSVTRASRRDTQLALRSNRRDSSSWSSPKLDCSSASSHPCSSADSDSLQRMARTKSSASASPMSHTVACTTSWPSLLSARSRLCPSTTTYRPSCAAGTTTIGTC